MTPITLPLDLVGVALIALLILFGAAILATFLSRTITGAPIPLAADLARWIKGIFKSVVSHLSPLLLATIAPLAAVFNYLWRAHSTTNAKAQEHAAAINNRTSAVVHHTIPAAKETAIFWANAGLYKEAVDREAEIAAAQRNLQTNINHETTGREAEIATAVKDLQSNIGQLHTELAGAVDNVDTKLTGDLNALAAHVDTALATLASGAAADLSKVRTTLLSELGAITSYATGVAQTVGQYAKTVAGQAETNAANYANSAAAAGIAGLWPGIAAPAEQARTGIAAEAPGTLTGSVSIPGVAPTTLAGAIAAVGTMAATAVTYVDECGIGLCNNMRTLSTFLRSLETLFGEGLLLALLAWIVTHPDDAANDAKTILQDFTAPFQSLVVDLVE